ncbi:MAG: lipid-A-disaccharide synthase [Bacteroidetes bacterium HGW-Bacteroidetes-14]|jgi:lipid-A-disaccharide synthase|nr:MAG: lipid-A-disaccharide synthase [Bacteroidetes bacterium HGW-Bacteroidetes-14]
MRYYIIAGEASGDLHGSNLMKSLKDADSEAQFRFWGGDLMKECGGEMVKHYKETAVMGFIEVIAKITSITENLRYCREDILNWKPDIVILIDYPGFNLRIAKFAKENAIKVYYYIAPKVWARGEGRIEKIRKYTDRLYIIFPFEEDYFRKRSVNALYFGNPLLDSIAGHPAMSETKEEFLLRNSLDDKPCLALLAGSRKHEIKYLIPRFREFENDFQEYNLLLAGAPSVEKEFYEKLLAGSRITLLFGETYSILKHSAAAAISSGTASLEAAIIGTPQVVCYGMNPVTAALARLVIKVKYVSLVNLILDMPLVKELLQGDCTPQKISAELKNIIRGRERTRITSGYKRLRKILGGEGASEKVAKSMIREFEKINDSNIYSVVHKTPMGALRIVCDDHNLIQISYQEDYEQSKEKAGAFHPILKEAVKQLDEYFAEKRTSFDLPIKLNGTDFQNKVWEELIKIPYGQVKTYGEIAGIVESRDASRAVGMACKMNPLLIVVPCHRVLGANNKLTGFAIGIDKKSYLLDLEKTYQNTDNNLFKQNI